MEPDPRSGARDGTHLDSRTPAITRIFGDPPADGDAPVETAVVGAAADTPRGVLVRGLPGPRHDHLDQQRDDRLSGVTP